MEYLDYLFIDGNSGETFFVQATNEADAWAIAERVFEGEEPDLRLLDVVSDEVAEVMGFDTY